MIFNCQNCGKEFKGFISRIKEGKEKYCSKRCSYIGRRGKITKAKGMPKSFAHRKKISEFAKTRIGSKNSFWGKHHTPETLKKISIMSSNPKKGWKFDSAGYILIFLPSHPFAQKAGYIPEQRLIVEKHLGRYLQNKEVVHHINKIKDNNSPENLMVFNNDGNHRNYEQGHNINPNSIIFDGRQIASAPSSKD